MLLKLAMSEEEERFNTMWRIKEAMKKVNRKGEQQLIRDKGKEVK